MNRYCIMMVIVVASWTHAARSDVLLVPSEYATIQSAIVASSDGDTILVAPGRYYEAINMLGKAVQLLGAQGQASTFIDATDLQSSVITCNSGEGPDTIIRRFTITGGTGTFENGRWNGAGMYNSRASPTVQNCTFSVNEVAGFIGDGGGMYNFRSDPIVDNCTFYRNVAFRGFGGGMCNIRSNPTVTGCRFEQNLSELEGGGMYNQDSHPTLEDCTFIENFSTEGGIDLGKIIRGNVHWVNSADDWGVQLADIAAHIVFRAATDLDDRNGAITVYASLFSVRISRVQSSVDLKDTSG